jgi:PKD repeat protein
MPAALVVAALSTACAYTNPTQPAPTTIDPTIPYAMTVGTLQGTGQQAGTISITARVANANGMPLSGVVVAFSATSGAVTPTNVATGASGTATTTFTGASDSTSTVSATVNGLTAKSIVAVPASTSGSGPTPAPGAQTPSAILNVSASATTGVPLTFTVSSAATGATWNWSFGDGATDQSTAFSTTHTYGRAGTYVASVSSSATTAGNAVVTVTDPAAGPAAPSAALGTTMSCNTASPTACNVSATFAGAPLASTATATAWDWGDGTTTPSATTNVGIHSYTQAGSFTVIATTTYTPPGGTLQTARSSQSVTISSALAPSYTVALAASPTSVSVGGSSTLTATVTPVNGAPTPTSFAWDCDGNGTTDFTTTTNTQACTYTTAGTTTSKVTVSATGSVATGTATTTVTVTAVPLVVAITGALTPTINVSNNYTATITTSTGVVPALLQWQWDDNNDGTPEAVIGSAPNPNTRAITFGSTGVHTIKVTVTETATGRTGSGLLTVTVQ